jgi:hypothetical protein
MNPFRRISRWSARTPLLPKVVVLAVLASAPFGSGGAHGAETAASGSSSCRGVCAAVHDETEAECRRRYACLESPIADRKAALVEARSTLDEALATCGEAGGGFSGEGVAGVGGCTQSLVDCVQTAERVFNVEAATVYRTYRSQVRSACRVGNRPDRAAIRCPADVRRHLRQCRSGCGATGAPRAAARQAATSGRGSSACDEACDVARGCHDDCEDHCAGNAAAEALCFANCRDKNCDALADCTNCASVKGDCTQSATTSTNATTTTTGTTTTSTTLLSVLP